jgi:hypothetical protein
LSDPDIDGGCWTRNELKACYHTEGAALPIPERFFFPYAVRTSRCGTADSAPLTSSSLREKVATWLMTNFSTS